MGILFRLHQEDCSNCITCQIFFCLFVVEKKEKVLPDKGSLCRHDTNRCAFGESEYFEMNLNQLYETFKWKAFIN